MKNGVPWDVAFGRDQTLCRAASIVFQEFDGRKFNLERMKWEES